MKPAKLLLLFMVAFAVLFAACGNSPTPDPLPPEAEKVLVSVDYATDELLSEYDSFSEFIEFEDENYQKIAFTTNVAAKDFKFIEIGLDEDSADLMFFEKKDFDTANLSRKSKIEQNTPRYATILCNIKRYF